MAHVYIPDQIRTKLDDKSYKCVLFRVSLESKAYVLFDLVSKKVVINRDVIFEEDERWNSGRSKA